MLRQLPEFLRQALRLWLTRPTQAALSMLGVAVGVGGVFLVVAVGGGAQQEIQKAMDQLGTGTVFLGVDSASDKIPFDEDFTNGLLSVLPKSLELAAPQRIGDTKVRIATGEFLNVRVHGIDSAYALLAQQHPAMGRTIVDLDAHLGQRVCVLGASLARSLYPRGDALGQELRLGSSWYQVVGVLGDTSLTLGSEAQGLHRDPSVYVPLNSPFFGGRRTFERLALRFSSEAALSHALPLLRRSLDTAGLADKVDVSLPVSALRNQYRVQRTVAALLMTASLIVLTVAGVGVMNTMLLNVSSRRTEIGLRRAIGATPHSVVLQFLLETTALTGLGGVLGIVLGFGTAGLLMHWTSWSLQLGLWTPMVAEFIAITLGGVFGGYPAWHAAKLAPVDALRGPV